MAGKIDADGILWLFRKGKLKEQFCPHKEDLMCGDWCPKFCEPSNLFVTICGNQCFSGIVDERREGASRLETPLRNEFPEKTRKRIQKEPRFWIRINENTLQCPMCRERRDISKMKKNKPKRCLNCKKALKLDA